ncbi:MAG: DNA gyrase inhibitor YacG [Phycisphaerales bacterium]|nr:DNA gyrase inhibitor YacG [Phycisphaerales bacterium]
MPPSDPTPPTSGGLPNAPPRCPTCRGDTDEGRPTFPFCSERCRLADLGRWMAGDYRISRPIKESDMETVD